MDDRASDGDLFVEAAVRRGLRDTNVFEPIKLVDRSVDLTLDDGAADPGCSEVSRARRIIIRAVNRHHGGRTGSASTLPVRTVRAT